MATFVLVHGSWHGAWCWHRVIPELEALGHRVIAPDLPGHGDDRTPLAELTLQAYAERITNAARGAAEPPVLVGHSFAGVVITQAAEIAPEQVGRLVYLAAFLPANGESLSRLAAADPGNRVTASSILTPDQQAVMLDLAQVGELLYPDCAASDVDLARRRLCPEALAPLITPVKISADRAGRIPRSYIQCLQDAAVPVWLQRQMYTAVPCTPILDLPTGHSPFFAAPADLARQLSGLASRP